MVHWRPAVFAVEPTRLYSLRQFFAYHDVTAWRRLFTRSAFCVLTFSVVWKKKTVSKFDIENGSDFQFAVVHSCLNYTHVLITSVMWFVCWDGQQHVFPLVTYLTLDAQCWHVGTAIKHPVPDRVKPVICNFWHPGTLTLRPERQSALMSKITHDRLNPVWYRMLYSCTIWQQWASEG